MKHDLAVFYQMFHDNSERFVRGCKWVKANVDIDFLAIFNLVEKSYLVKNIYVKIMLQGSSPSFASFLSKLIRFWSEFEANWKAWKVFWSEFGKNLKQIWRKLKRSCEYHKRGKWIYHWSKFMSLWVNLKPSR